MNEGKFLIVEDNLVTANFLKEILVSLFPNGSFSTTTSVSSTRDFLTNCIPRLVLIDIGLPDESGLVLLKEIKQKFSKVFAVIVTSFGDDESIFEAISLGADGYILKDEDRSVMIQTLSRIQNGEPPLSAPIALKLMKHFQSDLKVDVDKLSPREKETLKFIAKGLTVPEVAKEMGLSRQTVASYVKVIYQKLHVSSRAEVTKVAIKKGYI